LPEFFQAGLKRGLAVGFSGSPKGQPKPGGTRGLFLHDAVFWLVLPPTGGTPRGPNPNRGTDFSGLEARQGVESGAFGGRRISVRRLKYFRPQTKNRAVAVGLSWLLRRGVNTPNRWQTWDAPLTPIFPERGWGLWSETVFKRQKKRPRGPWITS